MGLLSCLAAGCLGIFGCGDDPHLDSGREALFLSAAFPDYLDPQLSYTLEAWEGMWNSYIPLLTYRHAPGIEGTEVVPGLAEDLPEISKDGRIYQLTLHPGLQYSDGSPVRASDIEFAIQRLFDLNSRGSGFYTSIVGASDYQAGNAEEISGISADDSSGEITIRLEQRRGTFTNELALMFAAPVPQDTPVRNQTETPPPATGPYRIAESDPNRAFVLETNPVWSENNAALLSEVPSASLDRITVQTVQNQSAQVTQVTRNDADFMFAPPPSDLLPEVKSSDSERFGIEPSINNLFFWMNTQTPPFDDVRVRRAVNLAIDPEAMTRIYGGLLTPLQQILPAGLPGHKSFELYRHDPKRARQLVDQAAPADRQITLWGDDEDPHDRAVIYLQEVLEDLGFEVNLRLLNASIYFDTIGNTNTPNLDIGWLSWYQDYPHPNSFLELSLNGEKITETANSNNALFDDQAINDQIDALGSHQLDPDTTRAYARLDRKIMRQAPWAPYGSRSQTTFVSERIAFDQVYFHPVFNHDYTSFALAE